MDAGSQPGIVQATADAAGDEIEVDELVGLEADMDGGAFMFERFVWRRGGCASQLLTISSRISLNRLSLKNKDTETTTATKVKKNLIKVKKHHDRRLFYTRDKYNMIKHIHVHTIWNRSQC